jgi:hypothetical protein
MKRGKLKHSPPRVRPPDDDAPLPEGKPTVRLNWDHAFVDHGYPTRLRAGDVFDAAGGEMVVIKVNECGAVCVLTALTQVTDKTEKIRVCANSEVHIKYRLGLIGLRQLLGEGVAAPDPATQEQPAKERIAEYEKQNSSEAKAESPNASPGQRHRDGRNERQRSGQKGSGPRQRRA